MSTTTVSNPFRPGVGHMPPHLAGRTAEQDRFRSLLGQPVTTDNLILTGLRGVGKTVLLESLKPIARERGWLWVGDDFTESNGLTEERIADSIVTDLSISLAPIFSRQQLELPIGFASKGQPIHRALDYSDLRRVYESTPGLAADKLKAVLRYVGQLIVGSPFNGIVFAYDEAQNLGDRADVNEYPLQWSLMYFSPFKNLPADCRSF